MIEDSCPVLFNDLTLLIFRPGDAALNVHASPNRSTARCKDRTAHGLVAGGGCNITRPHGKIGKLVDNDALQKDKYAVLYGAQLIVGPAPCTLVGKSYLVTIAHLDSVDATAKQ